MTFDGRVFLPGVHPAGRRLHAGRQRRFHLRCRRLCVIVTFDGRVFLARVYLAGRRLHAGRQRRFHLRCRLLGVVVTFDDRVFLARVHLALRRLNAGWQCRLCPDVGRLSSLHRFRRMRGAGMCLRRISPGGRAQQHRQGQNVQCIFHDCSPE
jgi:hypothetical protein